MKHKKGLFIALAVLVLALAGLISAKPLYNLYRDISFSWVERGEAEKTIKAFAEEKGISYGEYPQFIIDLYEGNPETKDFVLNYPFRKKQAVDLSTYDRSRVCRCFCSGIPCGATRNTAAAFLALPAAAPPAWPWWATI